MGLVGVALVTMIVAVGAWAVDEPLRRYLERRMNAQLNGYAVTVVALDLHPIGLSLDLYGVTVAQNALPVPPVAYFKRWTTSVQWRALLSGAVVADVRFEQPELYLTLDQAAQESGDAIPAGERGWQEAVEAVYPLKINDLEIVGGEVSYFDGRLKPVRVTNVEFHASNIRNVRTTNERYPSPIKFRGRILRVGTLAADGSADFLARPYPSVRTRFDLRSIPLSHFAPVLRHAHVTVDHGSLSVNGTVEEASGPLSVEIETLSVDQLAATFHYAASPAEARAARRVARAVMVADQKPRAVLDVKRARITATRLSFIDHSTEPAYRLFVSDATGDVTGFSNRREATKKGSARLAGRFMGSGSLAVDSAFRPGGRRPEFSLDLQIEDVDLPSLNDLFRARGGFDVASGRFSAYAEANVHNGRIEGYVKPVFADVDVYDRRQDGVKEPAPQVYEALVGTAAAILSNRARDEIATVTTLSGTVDDPNASTLDIVLGLLRNAFIKAILPGLEGQHPQKD